ncbi:MAG: ABC transporter ATP-binding protein [Erysipelotrichaceae bacterium]|uniref:ATP-binding cassette domain-containing protein n=1 Tax=Copranaerobaculum intestinale TaxID=2692629 RepID=A0A6N8U8N1_9FIRM|nr:ABC transporter ATP-binding protein [Copranaerobaculum intestinale]MBS6373416.1 ABC transporter ATP-binding protein [Erysipelotrichaceae bacterium]MXQ73714.1 ATP-binding cassette domain-containing protein [Copranaerobaculum intestinale]
MSERVMKEQEFYTDTMDRKLWGKIIRLLMEHKRQMTWLAVFMIISALLDVLVPLLNKYAIDTYVTNHESLKSLPLFIGIYLGAITLQCLDVYLFFRQAGWMESTFGKNLRDKAFRKLQNLSFSYFDKTSNGWLMARLTGDTARLAEIMAWSIVDLVWGFVVMFGIVIVMLIVNWQLALIVLVIVPPLYLISLFFQRRILAAHRQTRKINSQITAGFAEGINGAKTTKTLVLENNNFESFQDITGSMKHYSIRAARINAVFQPIVFLLSAIVIGALLTIGGNQILLKAIPFGTLTLFIQYANLFFDPLKQVARIMAELQMAQASAERIVGLLEEPVAIVDREDVIERYGTLMEPKSNQYEKIDGNVKFDHLNFHYYKEEPVLKDFCLDVKKGEMIALVGETGSGKSTIVNLLCRFYEPISGQILIDGLDYRERSIGWLHAQIGYVLQSPTLFSGTIKDNIRYGKLDATDEEIEHVAKVVNAHHFIMKMDKGYDSDIGEAGERLSTGEKQLISFARAIIADPSIVILDEATSSIDTQSERIIQDAIGKLLEGRTSFVVAHRLSTIVHADKILVMQYGEIVEQGTHEELLAKHGYYYELYTNQYREEQQGKLLKKS